MSDIHDLEQRLQALEDAFAEQSGKIDRLLEKSDKALDLALHAYKVDHYGYIWQYDCETKEYVKSNMRVCTPEIADRALHSRHIADKAVTEDKLDDNAVQSRNIGDNQVKSRNIGEGAVLSRHIGDGEVKSRNIGEKSITGDDFEGNIPNGKLADDAVSARNIQKGAVLPEKLDPDLLNIIYSAGEHGYHLSTEFGSSTVLGICQKALTAAFNRIWSKIEDITGESLHGISMVVSPTYFIGEDGCNVHITANTADTTGIFEHIAIYINGTLLTEADNVDYFEYDTQITETSVVKCEAKIMGITYTREKIITHYNSFWLGAGSSYQDIMDVEHVIPITNGMRGAYNVDVAQGDHIIIIVGESLAGGFLRADLNSVEINFTESTVTVDGKNYKVFTSEEAYSAGTYNIDING